jgi:hypothetical protein
MAVISDVKWSVCIYAFLSATRAVTSCSVLWLHRILILCRMSKHLSIEQLKQHVSDGAYVGHSAAAQRAAKQQPKEMRSASLSP